MRIKLTTYEIEDFNDLLVGEWHDCRFYDAESGESFFVELQKQENETAYDFANRCVAVAVENFEEGDLVFEEMLDSGTAEQLGFDTY